MVPQDCAPGGVQSDQSVDLKKATRLVNVIASINLFMWAITVIVLGPAMTLPAALTAAGLILLLSLVIGVPSQVTDDTFCQFIPTLRQHSR